MQESASKRGWWKSLQEGAGLPFFSVEQQAAGSKRSTCQLGSAQPSVCYFTSSETLLWFCSITTIAEPFWRARLLLEATLMQDEYNKNGGGVENSPHGHAQAQQTRSLAFHLP